MRALHKTRAAVKEREEGILAALGDDDSPASLIKLNS
jgi:hypothetical protein